MALPTAYLTSVKNVEAVFNAMRAAKAPPKFTQRFLEDLGFKSTADRLFINVFKALGFLTPDGAPTDRYFEFMDQTQSGRVLAEALEEAYADLFQLRRDAQNMERSELRGRLKTLTQGQVSDAVIERMAMTFQALAKLADFGAPRSQQGAARDQASEEVVDAGAFENGSGPTRPPAPLPTGADGLRLGGFVYNIELHLPESRDPAVYEALFKALKAHLLG
ncbi:MAG TPA: DUF5343 domain-containing protein [Solirubrobacteraceae bacterium]|nr:DUF5343 domain-containing protein [Solirubrobacteraceae bacterium]